MDSDNKPLVSNDHNSINCAIPDVVVNQSTTPDGQPDVNHVKDGIRIPKSIQPDAEQKTKLYKRRWYVLMVFSLASCVQSAYCNTWGPIAASSEEAFGWTDGDIALMINWAPVAYIIFAVFFSWIVDEKGLRVATLTAAFFVAVGACVRCITDKPPYVTWAVNVGQFFNGLGGPLGMAVPPALSSTWFPANERTTATAVGIIMGGVGSAVSFIIGPYMVSEAPPSNGTNTSNTSSILNCTLYTNFSCHRNNTDKESRIQKERSQIMKLLYIEAAFAVLVFMMVLLYFPAKPTLPPSITASIERYKFTTGCKKLIRNPNFWMICLTYGVSVGVYYSWLAVLDVNLKPHRISENEAGWLGFYGMLASSTSSLIVAKFLDVFSRHMKLFLVTFNIAAAGFFIWFSILVSGFIPNSVVSLYVSFILGVFFLDATPTLYFETACEVTYPVAEGVTTIALTLVNNIAEFIFLLVQTIPNIGTAWENWCLVGAIVFCIPVLCMMKERYNRLDIDQSHDNKQP